MKSVFIVNIHLVDASMQNYLCIEPHISSSYNAAFECNVIGLDDPRPGLGETCVVRIYRAKRFCELSFQKFLCLNLFRKQENKTSECENM